MISNAYAFRSLIGNQLHMQGDRHVWCGRLGPGKCEPVGHAGGASTPTPRAVGDLPPKGGHPTPRAPACAHRSTFEQSAQRRGKAVLLERDAASKLLRPGVGVQEKAIHLARLPASQGKKSFMLGEKRKGERTPFGLRPPVGSSGAGAHALMRAPALSCCMGCRP